MIKSIVQDKCAALGPFVRDLVENFRVGFSKCTSEAFHIGSIDAQLHADRAVDGIILHFLGDVASDGKEAFTKGEDVVEPDGDTEVIEL